MARSPCGCSPAGPVDGDLVAELVDWFRERQGTTDCDAILGGDPAARFTKCPAIVAETYAEARELAGRARASAGLREGWRPVDTTTLCPRLPAPADGALVRRGDEVWLRRVCPEHGEAEALVWRGAPDFDAWRGAGSASSCCEPAENPACPTECGLCSGHARQTCCVLLEVTQRCDLACPVCFAAAAARRRRTPRSGRSRGGTGACSTSPPAATSSSPAASRRCATTCRRSSRSAARSGSPSCSSTRTGCAWRAEAGYAERLADAGLSTVFLQFDGVDDAAYLALRGRPLAAVKERAILRCADAGLGVVLVPTVVRGVNLDRLGAILEFALAHAPAVRGVHLQPHGATRTPHLRRRPAAPSG